MRIVGMREAGGKTILGSARPVEVTRVPSAEARVDEEAAPAARDERDVRRRRAGKEDRRAQKPKYLSHICLSPSPNFRRSSHYRALCTSSVLF